MISVFISKALGFVTNNETLTRGMVGAKMQFEFGDEWSGLSKTAIFKAGHITRAVIQEQWDGNICTIPSEVLEKPGEALLVGLYGTDADKTLIIPTVWISIGAIKDGADPDADASTNGTLPVWAQIQRRLEDLIAVAPDGVVPPQAAVFEIDITSFDKTGNTKAPYNGTLTWEDLKTALELRKIVQVYAKSGSSYYVLTVQGFSASSVWLVSSVGNWRADNLDYAELVCSADGVTLSHDEV